MNESCESKMNAMGIAIFVGVMQPKDIYCTESSAIILAKMGHCLEANFCGGRHFKEA